MDDPEEIQPEYFGEPWPSGLCETFGARQVSTPVGDECRWCHEVIQEGDQGSFMNEITFDATDYPIGVNDAGQVVFSRRVPVHRECALRQAIGSYAHLAMGPHPTGACNDYCTCNQKPHVPPCPQSLSRREDALAVWRWMDEHGFPQRI